MSYRIKGTFLTGILLLIAINPAASQNVPFEWVYQYYDSIQHGFAAGYGIATDDFDDVYMCGSFNTSIDLGDTTLYVDASSFPNCNIFLAKYSPDGDMLWVVKSGGTDTANPSIAQTNMDRALYVATDADGGAYVFGNFEGTISFGNNDTIFSSVGPGDDTDIFLAKYDKNGVFKWAKHISADNIGNDWAQGISTDKQGGVVITGYFYGTATIGDTSLTSPGAETDLFIAKFDTGGVFQWARQITGTDGADFADVAIDPNGNINVGFRYWDAADLGDTIIYVTPSIQWTEVGLVQYDKNGDFQWIKQVQGNKSLGVSEVYTDAFGNVYMTGGFVDTVHFDDTSFVNVTNQNGDLFLAKYNVMGNELWVKHIRGYNFVSVTGLVGHGDMIYLSGTFGDSVKFDNLTLDNYDTPFGSDIYVVCYDDDGEAQWVKKAGGVNGDGTQAMSSDKNGNLYIAGGVGYGDAYFDPLVVNFTYARGIIAKIGLRIEALTITNLPCTGDSIGSIIFNASGGSLGLEYSIDNGSNYSSSPVFTNLVAGTYYISVRDSQNVVITDTVVLIIESFPISLGNDTTICLGDSVVLSVDTGYVSYVWNDPSNTTASLVADTAGLYYVTVTNDTGCIAADSLLISIGSGNTVDLGADISTCDKPQILGAGSNFVSYLWSTGASSQTISISASGQYYVTATDSFGCPESDTISVIIYPTPSTSITIVDASFSNCDGSATAIVSLGTAPYSYLWNDLGSQTSSTAIGLCGGSYTVTVTDANGCAETKSATVNELTAISNYGYVNDIKVYPNPANDKLFIQFETAHQQVLSVQLYSLVGELIYETYDMALEAGKSYIDLTNKGAGVYFLKVNTPEGSSLIKVVRTR